MAATKTIRVSERTHSRLAKLAARFNQPSTDATVVLLLAEHDELEAERAKRLALSEERIAEINRRRTRPLSEAMPHEQVLARLDERLAVESQ